MYRIRVYSFKVDNYEIDGVKHCKEEYQGKILDAIVTSNIVCGYDKKHYLNWAKEQIQNMARHFNDVNTLEDTISQTWYNDAHTLTYFYGKKYDAQCAIIINFTNPDSKIHYIERITVEEVEEIED